MTALLHPERVGVGAWENSDPNDPSANGVVFAGLKPIGFAFYYAWRPQKLIGDDGSIPFREGLWDLNDITTANLASIRANGGLLIGINEPWHTDPGWTYTSPTQALDAWPQLMALGNRLATPSPSGGDGIGWLDEFMAGVSSRGYRVDVVNVHYYMQYPNQNIGAFQSYLQGIHDRYNKPVVVTEWALYSNWGDTSNPQVPIDAQAAWATAGCQMMDTLDFIEGHSWFAAGTGAGGNLYLGSQVLDKFGARTAVGTAFYNMLAGATGGATTTPPPPPDAGYPSMSGLMNARGLLNRPNTGTSISSAGANTLSALLSGLGLRRR